MMKINIGQTIEFKRLSEISAGDTFIHGSAVCIKTMDVINPDTSDKEDNIVVDLNDGRTYQLSGDTRVIPIKSEVTVQPKEVLVYA